MVNSISELLDTPYGSLLKDVAFTTTTVHDGVRHHSISSWGCGIKDAQYVPKSSPEENTLNDVIEGRVCPKCLPGWWSYRNYPIVERVKELVELEKTSKNIGKVTKQTSAGTIQKRLAEIERLLAHGESLEAHCEGVMLEGLSAARERLLKAEKTLKKATIDPKTREKLEVQVQKRLVPSEYRNQNFKLDNTLKLIGISPIPALGYSQKTNLVRAVIDAYAIRQDNVAVLLAPAYFYGFILGELFFNGKNNPALVVSAEAPGDMEACENAAALWQPGQPGQLACLSEAISSGKALAG